MSYQNKTKLPLGVKFERIITLSPENISKNSVKEHIIEWSDINGRPIESISIKEYDADWLNQKSNSITIINKQLSSADTGIYKLSNKNSGYLIRYQPFIPAEAYNLWFIVSIKLKGENAFDVAFFSSITGGNPPTQGDANKPAGGG
jgi:hypothetical protein